ncbi:hypothetical protein WJX72_012312 [[Myrmecia] bisecta]|uniref:Uncharacterized protein n=1 Tax=[Myrmecia] bisecta TaxID=41462 RepID=A0AAW1Q6P9_9CHLO
MVWGANTGIGKTLISAGLAAAAARSQVELLYLKPVQTGFPDSCDASLVAACSGGRVSYAEHAAALLSKQPPDKPAQPDACSVLARTLFAWEAPTSPHTAVALEGRAITDGQLCSLLRAELNSFASKHAQHAQHLPAMALLETAGGVASPAPSGRLQCDAYRPLRLPGVLVGDGRLGGISATISAHESLLLRGYDTSVVVLMESSPLHQNARALGSHFGPRMLIVSLPACPEPPEGPEPTGAGGASVVDANLQQWIDSTRPQFDEILAHLQQQHQQRVAQLASAADAAQAQLWWPFTQHASLKDQQRITVADSRCGEEFAVYQADAETAAPSLRPQYDACASWWTQGMSAELQPRMVEAIAYGAARYGHIIFPETAYEPAVKLADLLLKSVGKGWADRVFYSDDGSTAVEVALKMAFRTYMLDHNIGAEEAQAAIPELWVVGLQNGYHGDTLGAMDAVAPSPFNGPKQTPWYSGRGLFLDPPTVCMVKGTWQVRQAGASAPPSDTPPVTRFPSREAVFSRDRDGSDLHQAYRRQIEGQLDGSPKPLAACILEPVLQGAGGMALVDPLYQRTLAQACRARNIPVIFDEVFSGLWRLGRVSAAEMLGVSPDIACYAKLLTGGTVPLAATLATKAVFDAFQGASKLDALLHGHSYSGHAIGCSAAVAALQIYSDPTLNPSLCAPASAGRNATCPKAPQCKAACGRLLELWDGAAVKEVSLHPRVKSVMSLGTVLAAELEPAGGGGGL